MAEAGNHTKIVELRLTDPSKWKEFFEKHEACPEFELDRSDNVPPQERDLF